MISVAGVTSLGRVQGRSGHSVTKRPYKPIMTHCFNNNITFAYLKGKILAKSQQMLQLFPHSREIWCCVCVCVSLCVCVCFVSQILKSKRKRERGRGTYKVRQTASQRDSSGFCSACFNGQIHHTVISCHLLLSTCQVPGEKLIITGTGNEGVH